MNLVVVTCNLEKLFCLSLSENTLNPLFRHTVPAYELRLLGAHSFKSVGQLAGSGRRTHCFMAIEVPG